MKPCLLSSITIAAMLTFPWFFWSKFKTLHGGDQLVARWQLLFINETSSTSLPLLHSLSHVSYRLSLISLFLSSFFRYHPWFSSDFCDARRSGSSVALPSFDFASCMEFHQFIILVVIPQTQPFVFFKCLRYENKHIISNTVIIRLQFLYTVMQFNRV